MGIILLHLFLILGTSVFAQNETVSINVDLNKEKGAMKPI